MDINPEVREVTGFMSLIRRQHEHSDKSNVWMEFLVTETEHIVNVTVDKKKFFIRWQPEKGYRLSVSNDTTETIAFSSPCAEAVAAWISGFLHCASLTNC
jgi:hypothetical protein